jgi:hypothetical protein
MRMFGSFLPKWTKIEEEKGSRNESNLYNKVRSLPLPAPVMTATSPFTENNFEDSRCAMSVEITISGKDGRENRSNFC